IPCGKFSKPMSCPRACGSTGAKKAIEPTDCFFPRKELPYLKKQTTLTRRMNHNGRQIPQGSPETSVTEKSQDRQRRSEEEAGFGGEIQSRHGEKEVSVTIGHLESA